MSDEHKRSKRLDRLVSDLLAGRRLRIGAGDAADQEAIRVAAWFATAHQNFPRMTPAFRRRLEARISKAQAAPAQLTRRRALLTGAAGMGALAGVIVGAGTARLTETPSRTRVARGGETVNPRPGRWVDVAALSDLPEGQAFRVTAGAVSAFLFRCSDQVTAVSSICSYMPCELNWVAGQAVLRCPCHPWSFTPDGRSTATVSPLPNLNKVMVRVENGRVLVMGT